MLEIEKEKKTYEDGLNDVWNLMKKICNDSSQDCMRSNKLSAIFGYDTIESIIKTHTPQEALEELKKFEEINKLHLGDEVEVTGVSHYGIVTRYSEYSSVCYILMKDGSCGPQDIKDCKKTGRHFSLIEELLNQMREMLC